MGNDIHHNENEDKVRILQLAQSEEIVPMEVQGQKISCMRSIQSGMAGSPRTNTALPKSRGSQRLRWGRFYHGKGIKRLILSGVTGLT
jgi:hypothetical protein